MSNQIKKQTRAAIYLRCSTDEQAKEGHYGLEVQEEKLKAFCKSQPEEYILSDEHIYRDEGYSGTLDIEQRPALARLIEDSKNDKFDIVLVYRLDRFFRNTRKLLDAFEKLKVNDVALQSATESFNTKEISGRLLVTFLAGIAEAERDTIKERTTRGKLMAAKSGKWVTGVPPYGYKLIKKTKKLEIIPEEAKIVKQLYQWIVYEKLPLRELERRMNEMKIPTPFRTRTTRAVNDYWYKKTIARILTNPTYTGNSPYRKYLRPFQNLTSITDPKMWRPDDEGITIEVPEIISKELYESAKNQLLENRNLSTRNQKREYLYSQLVHCGKCGFRLASGYQKPRANIENSEMTGKLYHGTYRKPDAVGTTKRCPMCSQYAESRMEPIWEVLKEVLRNPKNMLSPLKQYAFKEENPRDIQSRITEIESSLLTIQRKKERAQDLFINEDEEMSKDRLKEMMSEFTRDENKLKDEKSRMKQRLLTKEEKEDRETVIKRLYEKMKDRLDNVSYSEKARIIHLFVERITLYPQEDLAVVAFKFPESISVPQEEEPKKVSQKETGIIYPLVLSIKTITETQRRIDIIRMNPGMYLRQRTTA
jgi:site-specific DNA recombinase